MPAMIDSASCGLSPAQITTASNGALVQVVERGVAGEGADHLGLVAGERVGERQELRRRLADAEHPQRRRPRSPAGRGVGRARRRSPAAARTPPRPPPSDQALQPHDRLRRMQRRGQRQVEAVRGDLRVRVGDRHHRQAARRAGRLQAPRERQGLVADADQVDDRRLDLQVAQRGDRRERTARGHGAPAEAVEPLGQRSGALVVARHDQYSSVNRHMLSCGELRRPGPAPPRIDFAAGDARRKLGTHTLFRRDGSIIGIGKACVSPISLTAPSGSPGRRRCWTARRRWGR